MRSIPRATSEWAETGSEPSDKNKENNCADNLYWSTIDTRMETARNVNAILVCFKDDKRIYTRGDGQYTFKTALAASKHFKYDSKNIGTICRDGSNCRLTVDGRSVDFFYEKDVVLETRPDGTFLRSTTRPIKIDKRRRA